jgi:hypothetical protein
VKNTLTDITTYDNIIVPKQIVPERLEGVLKKKEK